MTVEDAIAFVSDIGANHFEIAEAAAGGDLSDDAFRARIKKAADENGVELSNYVVAADFSSDDVEGEIARTKEHIDRAAELGIPLLRHDVVPWGWRESDQADFERTLEKLIEPTREVADYAATKGITTSVENHGMAFNLPERIRRLIDLVDRKNFRTTLDVGNFLCLDENPVSAVTGNLPYASIVHLKDFYVRSEKPGEGWLETPAGNHLCGAIVGYGDMPIARILERVKQSGYDGPFTIEFEGLENPRLAVETGLANIRRIWEEV